jgi:hypothetical protein
MMADAVAAHSSSVVAARSISVPDDAAAWERLGFAVAGGATQVGGVRIELGAPQLEIAADGLAGERPDGLQLVHARAGADAAPPDHPNGAVVIDHVVALTDDLRRTADALVAAGLDLRREQGPMAFFRLGELILELVQREHAEPGLWGLVVVVEDVDDLGELVGEPKDAVQPGRRIATVRREAGLKTALAFMTPRAQPRPSR